MRFLGVCVAFLVSVSAIDFAYSEEKKVIKNFHDYVNWPVLKGRLDRSDELTAVSLWRSDVYYEVAFEKENLDLKAKFREMIKGEFDKIDKVIDVKINYREDNPNFYFVGLNDFFNQKFVFLHEYMLSISSRDIVNGIKKSFAAGNPCHIITTAKPLPSIGGLDPSEIDLSFIAMNMDADYDDVVRCALKSVLSSFGIRLVDKRDYYFNENLDTIFHDGASGQFGADDLAVIEFLYYSGGIVSNSKLKEFLSRSMR